MEGELDTAMLEPPVDDRDTTRESVDDDVLTQLLLDDFDEVFGEQPAYPPAA